MKTNRRERADGQETREAILEAAAKEFSEKGFDLASVREICKRAKVNSALANRYFGSKEGLYRTVARRLFGDLGRPLEELSKGVKTEADWRAAITAWVDDFLFMTLPSEKAQKLCAGLFKQEVTNRTKFHDAFTRDFGKPIYDALRDLLALKEKDETELELWTSSVWAQVSVYALADGVWHRAFRPSGVDNRAWAARVRDHVCGVIFRSLEGRR